ncbi:molecular chaperone DnaJ [Pseudobutyrivibrio xylanivorans]|uniref:Molecular chaperone DnaJ n=1 Tax=Pseudobutyrivibrio xylanivorans TaxID=185007 RepID=A0A5P6VQR7_PSEXY|nr:molecular chaperone DnaJ [Pseudobutyrivibrio xylanivorans]QFJ54947.1 molecular chaperone DnaJ [Pseudobutyrivibrio xylanivorans]
MAKNLTCQSKIDMQALERRHKELEKAWNDLLKEKREVEARIHTLEQQEKQFSLKWDMLIQETQKLADDKRQFERKKKFYEQVQANSYEPMVEQDNIVHGELFFSGVSNKKDLKKRYKDLIKIYHPDSDAGDTATVAEINREYEDLKAQMN